MINVTRLRAMIGWLGMALPWIVVLLLGEFPDSISETFYYQETVAPFMIILGAASLLLMYYDGYDKLDDIINTIGSIFGLGICLFPCAVYGVPQAGQAMFTEYAKDLPVGTFMIPMHISDIIHTVCAIAFFLILAFNALFRFTKTNGTMTKNKKIRNIIYIVCGCGMLGSFVLYFFPWFWHKIWVIETIALTFFGISWLTKANCYKLLFADKK